MRKLLVWQRSHQLALTIGAGSKAQFGRYLNIAQGSLAEVEYYLILGQDLQYLPGAEYEMAESLRSELGFLLHRLIESLNKK